MDRTPLYQASPVLQKNTWQFAFPAYVEQMNHKTDKNLNKSCDWVPQAHREEVFFQPKDIKEKSTDNSEIAFYHFRELFH